jgi:putative spermidine/putrescine transport system substrate-binding protein
MLPDSLNSWLLNINTKKAPNIVPSTLDAFLTADWKGKLVMAGYNGQFFTGYGMKNGSDAMVKLIDQFKAGNLTLSDNPDDLLSTGDKPIEFAGQLYSDNPAIALQAIQDAGVWIQFGGVNAFGKNNPGAELYAIWNAYDPAWITSRLTDPNFAYSSVPWPGLPKAMLSQAVGLMKLNSDAMEKAAIIGQWETKDTRDKWNTLIKTAGDEMYK